MKKSKKHILTRAESSILSVRLRDSDISWLADRAASLDRTLPDFVRRVLLKASAMSPDRLEKWLKSKPLVV